MESEHSSSVRMFGDHCWKHEVPQRDVEGVFPNLPLFFAFSCSFLQVGIS